MRIRHKKYDLGELARRIAAARMNAPGEAVRFDALQIENIESVLGTCVEFRRDIPETDRRSLVAEAAAAAAENDIISAESLKAALQSKENSYLRQNRPQQFVLASSFTISFFNDLSQTRINGATISFSRTLPERFRRKRVEHLLDQAIAIERPDRLTAVRVSIQARTHAAAFNEAKERFDLLRGIWNYWNNRRTLMRRVVVGERLPINAILPGPAYTLHHPNGSLAAESVWGEPKHFQFARLYNLAPHWVKLKTFEKQIRDSLAKIRYREDLEKLFIRYVRALDLNDFDVAFNKLWGVFEHLAASVGSYDNLISRTLFTYREEDRLYTRLLLEHLRDIRNGMVHFDEQREEMMTYVYQLKWITEQLLRFHLSFGKNFSSISAAGDFLDLPSSTRTLKDKMDLYRMALKYQAD